MKFHSTVRLILSDYKILLRHPRGTR